MAARASQIVAESLTAPAPNARASQIVAEGLVAANPRARASQIVVEVLLVNLPVAPVFVFPALPGLAYPVVRRANFRTKSQDSASSGRRVAAQIATWPIWEWDLDFEYLPDFPGAGATASDLQTLMGFVLAQYGAGGWFAYQDDTYNKVTGLQQAIGDGSTPSFTLVYQAGLSPYTFFEPIGYLNQGATFNLYINGTLQSSSTYSFDQSQPHNQRVNMTFAPPAGAVISVDMSFYYAVHFKDDTQEFEQFMSKFWMNKKLTLESVLA